MSHYKPYPAYKDSGVEWLGKVPEGWTIAPYKAMLDIQNGADYKHIESDDGFPVIGSGGIFAFASQAMYQGESVLLGRKGTIDKPLYFNGAFWAVDTMYWSIVKPEANGRFAYYVATTIPFDMYSTNTALPSMTKSVLGVHSVAVPSRLEQDSIAAHLDRETIRIDALVDKKTRFMELLREKRQALITHAVTKGLDRSVKMKDSGVEWLGNVPEHWTVSKLGYETWVRARLGWKGLKAEEYVTEGFAFLATPNIKGKYIDFINVNFITEERYNESPEIKLQKGDVLLAKDGSTLGTVNIIRELPRPTTVNSSIAVITSGSNLRGTYLYYYFRSTFIKHTIQSIKGGMGVPHLFQADLNKFDIPIPSIEEQREICMHLDCETTRIDTLIQKTQHSIDLLKERRSALITAAVTGQIDLRQAA